MISLIAQLPLARGRVIANAPIGRQTWFGVGGPAEVLFRPADIADLAGFLAALPPAVPVSVIGIGSNLLVRDGGIPGIVIRLGRGFAAVAIDGEDVRAGGAALDRIVAFAAADAGLGGLEFLSGIPGSVGGSLRMNAGAYGREMKHVLVSAIALDRSGKTHAIDSNALGLSYRRSELDPSWVIVEARLHGSPGDCAGIAARLNEIRAAREATQPVRARTGGSTFKNPPGDSAWRLVDAAGCRGLVRGGAIVSQQHANFLINTGTATAADLEDLGEEVRHRVYEHSGIMLEWEIERIGLPGQIKSPSAPFRGKREGLAPAAWEGKVVASQDEALSFSHLTPPLSAPKGQEGDILALRSVNALALSRGCDNGE
ncbi:MAG: UDP-N-acetylmuramate dehydrogenase [Alphaproteobacteria bacterium]|nr:UDP-N-acetylmuramate dehydrogenase [Alphaproteobacteria bacterium]MBV9816378.1 UDP-N-acetylmuramate dehydrogenase [Alphaproteobacteria bacterium]